MEMRRTVLLLASIALTVLLTSGVAVLLAMLVMPEEAKAAYPGQNGRIAYSEDTCGEGCSGLFTKMPDDSTSVSLGVDGYDPAYTYGGDRLVYSGYNEVYAIPASGGAPEQLTHNGNGPMSFSDPTLSPDGQTLLYEGFNTDTREGGIYTLSVTGGEPTLIAADGWAPEWSPDGKLISYYYYDGTVGSQGTIRTVPTAGGTPTTIVNDACDGQHSWAGDGQHVAYISCERGFYVLKTASSTGGTPHTVYETPDYIRSPAYSPDERHIAFVGPDPNDANRFDEGFMVPSEGGIAQQITYTRYGVLGLDWGVRSADTAAPRVEAVGPANSATGVGRRTDVTASFSEEMDPTSITEATFKLYKCTSTTCTTQLTNVTLKRSTDGLRAILNPYGTSSTKLSAKTKYKAVLTTGAKDVAGNALDQNATTSGNQRKVWYFTPGSRWRNLP
jgi:hypothetical protein